MATENYVLIKIVCSDQKLVFVIFEPQQSPTLYKLRMRSIFSSEHDTNLVKPWPEGIYILPPEMSLLHHYSK